MIPIHFQDKNIVLVDKPPGMPVQPDPSRDLDLLTALTDQLQQDGQLPANSKLFLIHRLDRPVGGIMVFAKTHEAAKDLSRQFQERRTHKDYLALVTGHLKEELVLEDYLKKLPGKSISVVSPNGKIAQLRATPIELVDLEEGPYTLVSVRLGTGRHHQIRVQLAHHGHGLWGDTKYNPDFQQKKGWFQIALWSHKLRFIHPITNKPMSFESHYPTSYPWTKEPSHE